MKRLDTPPPRSLVLRDQEVYDTVLRVTGSNRGEPYRETLLLTFERERAGAWPVHIVTAELEPAEEQELRELLNVRAATALRHVSASPMPADVPREVLIWDMDRIMVTDVTESTGHERLSQLAQRSPHNTFHLLMSVAVAKGGDVRVPWQPPAPPTAESDRLELELAHRHLDAAGIPRERDGYQLPLSARMREQSLRAKIPDSPPSL